MENKNSYFSLILPISEKKYNEIYLMGLEDKADLIFNGMGVKSQLYRFDQTNKDQIIYFFQTDNRKRKGQLDKYCQQHLPKNQEYDIKGMTKFVFETEIKRFEKNENFKLAIKPDIFNEYSASDILIFENRENWHPWQKNVYEIIFDSNGNLKNPDPRHIVSLIDKQGNSGKSSFFKWMYFKRPDLIGRIGYGSASQLRSAAINIGKKQIYIVDLARSKSKDDREEDLLSVLEDLKSGFITNNLYGSGKTLIMEPPHIIVSSNYNLKYELLSSDRWEIYEILANKKLKVINQKSTETAKKS